MKSEERHQLQENDLAGWLQVGLWNFIKQNGSYVLLVLALGFLGFQLWRMYETKQAQKLANGFAELRYAEEGNEPVKLLDVIDTYGVKPIQAEAYLALGRYYNLILTSPAEMDAKKLTREQSLDKALTYYKNALEAMPDDLLVSSKAHLGIAAVLEDQGQWDKAKAEYEIMADKSSKYAGTPFQTFAAARLAELSDRQSAPRLAMMIPPPAPVRPETNLPSNLGPAGNSILPGMMGAPTDFPPFPRVSPTPTSLPPASPLGPFILPPQGVTVTPPDAPATAPALSPVPLTPAK